MSSSARRVVLTGIGVVSPIGLDLPSVWQSLQTGRSGVRAVQAFDVSALPVRIGGEVVGFDPRRYLEKKEQKSLKVMARTIKLAVAAAQLAVDDAALDRQCIDPTRFGVTFGSGQIAAEMEELAPAALVSANCQPGSVDVEKWAEFGVPTMPPLWMLKYLPNMLACHVSILHNAQGPNNTITTSEVAGLLALGEAYRSIGRDQADLFLVGGAESKMNLLSLVRQCLFQPLSRRNEVPEKACRPFDRNRDGMVLGEGATVLAVEELEHARRRGARIYAELVGYAAACDTRRTGAGLAQAMRHALAEAGIGPEDVDHVNAFGSGTVDGDAWEARALAEVFGANNPRIPVVAIKSYFGTLGAGSGPIELAASLLALHHGVLPPTLNYEEPDPACPITVAAGMPRPVTRPYVLKLTFTDLGQCAAVVCRQWP